MDYINEGIIIPDLIYIHGRTYRNCQLGGRTQSNGLPTLQCTLRADRLNTPQLIKRFLLVKLPKFMALILLVLSESNLLLILGIG